MGFRQQMQQAGDTDQEQFLDDLVSQLLEESQSDAKGPPPASRRFIKMLPRINHSEIDKYVRWVIALKMYKAYI